MLLTESYRSRLIELAGIKINRFASLLKEVEDMYANSDKRVKFDINIMKQAIEGGMEVGMVFQSNNEKYTMPTWKMRVIQPVAMGYDKKGQLVIRGVHVVGQSEKKAIQTGVRSAEAKNEWRLFKASNVKSMFLTGKMFDTVSLPGYNPNDSAMTSVIASFNPQKAATYQKQLQAVKQAPIEPTEKPIEKPAVKQTPVVKTPKPPKAPTLPAQKTDGEKNLEKKIDKLNKLI
jgi:hypothetical protein